MAEVVNGGIYQNGRMKHALSKNHAQTHVQQLTHSALRRTRRLEMVELEVAEIMRVGLE